MMSNKRPIFTPDDMKGLTIRVQESPTYISLMKALGANPVPMPYVEVYLAMKQGTIDGMELPSFSVTADKFQEVTKFYSSPGTPTRPSRGSSNLKKYQALPPDLQKAMDESMKRRPATRNRKIEVEREKSDFDIMQKAGTADQRGEGHQAVPGAHEARSTTACETKVGKEFMERAERGHRRRRRSSVAAAR